MFEKIKAFFIQKIIAPQSSELKNNLRAFWLGAFLVLAFAPFHLVVVAPISLSIFFTIIDKINDEKKSHKKYLIKFYQYFCGKVFWRSFFYCFGFFVFGIYWICNSLLIDIARYGWLIPFAITLIPALMALYFAILVNIYKLLINRFSISFTYQKIILFSTFWLLFEVVRANLFTGFPWNLLGYIWILDSDYQYLAQGATIVGIYGMSLLACLVSLSPILIINYSRHKLADKILLSTIILCFIANVIFGVFYIDKNYFQHLAKLAKLRLVQANIQQQDKWLDSEKYENLLKHIKLTNSQSLENIDAVIWSETSIPYAVDVNNQEMMAVLAPAIPENGWLMSGAIRLQETNDDHKNRFKVWNSMFVFDKNGVVKSYDKQHLVPFGEYVPLHQYLSFLFIDEVVDKITGGGSGFATGQGNKLINLTKFSFNPLLCYEVIFSREVLDKNLLMPNLFVNLTNDSWFGNSIGPYQHLQIAQMRAIEYARPMIRVAQTGITVNINHYGSIVNKINLNQEGVIDVEVYKNNGTTFYAKYGHLPIIILALLLLILSLFNNFFDNIIRSITRIIKRAP